MTFRGPFREIIVGPAELRTAPETVEPATVPVTWREPREGAAEIVVPGPNQAKAWARRARPSDPPPPDYPEEPEEAPA